MHGAVFRTRLNLRSLWDEETAPSTGRMRRVFSAQAGELPQLGRGGTR